VFGEPWRTAAARGSPATPGPDGEIG